MSNSSRALRQVVSLDGWIATFDADDTATVHADVVFREGRFGAEQDDKVRFRLSLRRAEIVVIAPDTEPLRVIRSSVERTPAREEQTRLVTHQTTAQAHGKAGLSLSSALTPGADLALGAEAHRSLTTRQELTEKVAGHVEQHFTTLEGHPAWEVRAIGRDCLDGSPWDAAGAPRLKVKRQAERNADGDKPTMRFEMRCRREDIEISDLELKDPEKQGWFARRSNRDVNLAAAEQVIKEELLSAGFLQVADLNEKHADVVIADVIVSEDW
ncbi:hypothetical protein [uncultured Roseobacter sp.]|uniref:hypothetical protein n=1 Tax=uncultured Roseobacter sp. TaxID=114847 RepID=UPI00260CD456|nr:hypothetical protein [uncultured Roseobacter sp.]